MTKTITLQETLSMVGNPPQEVPPRIAKTIMEKAAKDSVQNIGGFPVVDHLLQRDRLDEAKAKQAVAIEAFNRDKVYLVAKLASIGIDEHLAVVPTIYWKNLCERHGLETVSPDFGGRIQVNTKVPYELTEAGKRRWNQVSAVFSVASAISAMGIAISILAGSSAIIETTAACMASSGLAWLSYYIGGKRGNAAVRKYLARTPYSTLIRELVTPQRDYRWSNSLAQLVLPMPPVEVVLLLRKLRDHRELFTVTADPSALRLEPSAKTLFLKGHAIEEERIRQELLDPIITISHNNATAVLAQFGDFEWELEVIEGVMGSVPLAVIVRDCY